MVNHGAPCGLPDFVRYCLWQVKVLQLAYKPPAHTEFIGSVQDNNTAQANCNKIYDLQNYRLGMAIFAFIMLAIAWLFLVCSWVAHLHHQEEKRDGLDV